MNIFRVSMHHIFQKTLLCLFSVTLLVSGLNAANLHTILICDTTADQISSSVEGDLAKIRAETKKISSYTDLTLVEKVFIGQDVNGLILEWLDRQVFEEDDAVILFFSGHGYRTDTKTESVWPNIYLTPVNKGIDFYLLTQMIKAKKPRFMLAVADCCNNILPERFAPPMIKKNQLFLSYTKPDVKLNYQQLFLYSSGSIIASSSIPGEFSWGTRRGGLYTTALVDSLGSEVEGTFLPDWQVLLERASVKIIDRDIGQTPQYELNLH